MIWLHVRRGEQAAWDVFMENMEAIGSIVPWMLTEGNHERDVPFTGDNYANTADDSGGDRLPCHTCV